MGGDGLPEYRLRAADDQPVYGGLRLGPEDEQDGWYKGCRLEEYDRDTEWEREDRRKVEGKSLSFGKT